MMSRYGVYDIYPGVGPVLKARFDKEDDAREYVELLKRKYPARKYSLLRWEDGAFEIIPI